MTRKVGIELPRAGWVAVIRWTAGVTLLSVLASLIASEAIMETLSQGLNGPGVLAAVAMPMLLGTPMMFYMMLGRQKLKYANLQLQVLASTDWLTNCLNRREFTTRVSTHLKQQPAVPVPNAGALLIIDADHFKTVNDRFGHEHGDAALRLIAEAISAAVQGDDLVGRLGGEEFGVFLHGADMDTAAAVADRVRLSIMGLSFAPHGHLHPLSVSVGGVICQGEASFAELFRIADQRLYGVKRSGRNRVDLAVTAPSFQAA